MGDAPDWVTTVAVTVIVENVPVIPEAAKEAPAGAVDVWEGDDADYKPVVTWTVTEAKVGELLEVSMITDDYETTQWKLVIGATTFFNDLVILSALTLPLGSLRLKAGTAVTLYAKSDGATTVSTCGSIVAKELG